MSLATAPTRELLDRKYRAVPKAGRKISKGYGVQISMFLPEEPSEASEVGGGVALGEEPMISGEVDSPDIEFLPETFAVESK